MSQHKITSTEVHVLEETLSSDYKHVNIRLREGEYQYELSKVIADFQLELCFPDVKALIKKIYGEEKADDVQLVRKIQTILKKMEKSGVIKILPKIKPWELQRYALLSFKFIDSDKNQISFATDEQIKQARERLKIILNQQKVPKIQMKIVIAKICILTLITALTYTIIVWSLIQSSINPIIVVTAFSLATLCAIILGRTLSKD